MDCVEKYGAGLRLVSKNCSHPTAYRMVCVMRKSLKPLISSARFICGTQEIHLELEQKIAKMHNTEDAILYAACFDANAGIFEVVLNKVFGDLFIYQEILSL